MPLAPLSMTLIFRDDLGGHFVTPPPISSQWFSAETSVNARLSFRMKIVKCSIKFKPFRHKFAHFKFSFSFLSIDDVS